MFKITFLSFLLFCFTANSQERSCGKDAEMLKIMNNPVAKQKYMALQQRFAIELNKIENSQNRMASPLNTIYVPVAVHYPAVSITSTEKSCLRALAQNQIDVLNADYNAVNDDISLWTPDVSAFYPGTAIGSLNIQFVLATVNHPTGSTLVNGDKAVTFGTNFLSNSNSDAQWAGYLNIVCRNANGNLGYSPLGGEPAFGETVVIAPNSFGGGSGCSGYVPSSPYNLGRTLTHEIGHFFNLDHTFAGCTTSANCATTGDEVCDTPASNASVGGCPVAGAVTKCTVKTLTMNYMDYTNDACMYMFTVGQANRMQAYYNAISDQFLTTVLSSNKFLVDNFSVNPNPNNGKFIVSFKKAIEKYEIKIFDSVGRIIFTQNYNSDSALQNEISLENQPRGIYFLSIKSDNAILTKKISVQ